MYARMGRTEEGTTGAAEVYGLHRLAGADDLVLSLWQTAGQAAADPTAEWYEIEYDAPGGTSDEQSLVAALVSFAGPMSDPVRAATARVGTERIRPLMANHPGTVRSLTMWQPERRCVLVIVLATSVDAIEDGQRVARSAAQQAGEDPALLPGPDRVDLYRVRSTAGVR